MQCLGERCRYDFRFGPKWAAMASTLSRWAWVRLIEQAGDFGSGSAGLLSGELELTAPVHRRVHALAFAKAILRAARSADANGLLTFGELSGDCETPDPVPSQMVLGLPWEDRELEVSCIRLSSAAPGAGAKLQVFRDGALPPGRFERQGLPQQDSEALSR
jgi:hypothetical protein